MSDNEFDDNCEASIGVMGSDDVKAGSKRTHDEISKAEDVDDFDSGSDESDNELNETGDAKKDKSKKPRVLPNNGIAGFSRKDKTLQEILDFLEKQPPIIPDPIIDFYLKKNGLQLQDSKLKKLISIATTKFISDIAIDTYEYSRIRSATAVYNANNGQQKAKQLLMGQQQQKLLQQEINSSSAEQSAAKPPAEALPAGNKGPSTQQQHNDKDKVVLRMSDLSSALKEYGLDIEKPDFYR